jgi:hypothetical protein
VPKRLGHRQALEHYRNERERLLDQLGTHTQASTTSRRSDKLKMRLEQVERLIAAYEKRIAARESSNDSTK